MLSPSNTSFHNRLEIKSILTINVIVVLSALLFLAGCGSSQLEQTTSSDTDAILVKLSWEHGPQFLGFYIAEINGYYAEEGLDVSFEPLTDMSDYEDLGYRVADGDYDFAIGGSGQIAQQPDAEVGIIAAFYQLDPATFFANADSGIQTPADFAGKRVAIKGGFWKPVLEQLLIREGLTLEDVELVPVGFDMTPFYAGEVDIWAGFVTNEVILARQQGIDVVTFPLHEYGIRFQENFAYTSRRTLEADSQRAVRFLSGSIRGWDWAVSHPQEAVDLMMEAFPELTGERSLYLAAFEASIPLLEPGGLAIGTLNCDIWSSSFALQTLANIEGACNPTLLDAVWERAE